jgi:hypothetical protein
MGAVSGIVMLFFVVASIGLILALPIEIRFSWLYVFPIFFFALFFVALYR